MRGHANRILAGIVPQEKVPTAQSSIQRVTKITATGQRKTSLTSASSYNQQDNNFLQSTSTEQLCQSITFMNHHPFWCRSLQPTGLFAFFVLGLVWKDRSSSEIIRDHRRSTSTAMKTGKAPLGDVWILASCDGLGGSGKFWEVPE